MGEKGKKSLEELVHSVSKGIKFPGFETLRDFETKALKIARRYKPNEVSHPAPHGGGITIVINGRPITVARRQKGCEDVISKGVFDEAITRISEVTGIPYNQLKLYFLGSGKPYKRYKREFETRYGL